MIEPTITMVVTATELQMLHEAVKRTRPFADLSPELAEAEAALERRLDARIADLRARSIDHKAGPALEVLTRDEHAGRHGRGSQ